jgi:hypothetical protein
MSADIVRFSPRRSAAIWLTREAAGGWQVLGLGHAWSHGDYADAVEDAIWLSDNRGLPVRGLATLRRVITTASER